MARKGFLVKVTRPGSKTMEVAVKKGDSVADAISLAGLNLKDSEVVQVNGEELDADELSAIEVEDGDRVILVKNIQGGVI